MSRYIDADDVANAIYHHFPSIRTMADARGIIEEAPSIDIVRCKECKWFDADENESDSWHLCTRHFGMYINFAEDDYCSYGERKE